MWILEETTKTTSNPMQLRDILLTLLLLAVVGLGLSEAYQFGVRVGVVRGVQMMMLSPPPAPQSNWQKA